MPQEPHAVERNIGHHLSFGKLFTNWNELSDNPAWWVGGQKKTHTHTGNAYVPCRVQGTISSSPVYFRYGATSNFSPHYPYGALALNYVNLPACLPASWRVNCEQIVMGRSSYCFANTNKNGMKRFEATNLHGEVYYFPWKKEMSRKLLCGCSTCER